MKKLILIILSVSTIVFAQSKSEMTEILNEDIHLSFSSTFQHSDSTKSSITMQKKPGLAALYSGIIPGAGQFYNRQYWKTAVFALVEIAAITTAIIYNKKGDDQTAFFES